MSRRSSTSTTNSSSNSNNSNNYRAVSSSHDSVEEEENNDLEEISLSRLPVSLPRVRGRRRRYESVAANEEDEADEERGTQSTTTTTTTAATATTTTTHTPPTITLTLLDVAHKKFSVPAHPSWTVQQLKAAGTLVHKVPPSRQRLIFRGKLLEDTQTLDSLKLNADGMIVHLFPKPRVIVEQHQQRQTADHPAACTEDDDDDDDHSQSPSAAHVPTIVLNSDEAERRSQILVLGSPEYMEAQSNVKLFSFMLMMISTIELLNLLAVAMGPPASDSSSQPPPTPGLGSSFALGDDLYAAASSPGGNNPLYNTNYNTDDVYPDDDDATNNNITASSIITNHSSSHNHTDNDPYYYYPPLQPWGFVNTVDLILSLLGIYVAMIGMRAANETTLRLAKQYLYGTVLVGIGWMLLNYYMTVIVDNAIEEEHEQHHPDDDRIPDLTESQILQSALSVMVLPGMVWMACCLRAFQFQQLLEEAEGEASARIQAQLREDDDEEEEEPQLPAVV